MTEPTARNNLSRSRRGVMALITSPRRLWRFLRDADAPKLPKMMAVLAVLYVVMPFDLVSDLVPFIGWLDDLGLTAVALGYIASKAAKYEDEAEVRRVNAERGGEAIEVKPAGS